MNKVKWDALMRRVVISAAIAVALAGAYVQALAQSTEVVYLYVGGTPVLQPSDSYDGGIVFGVANNPIGIVPNPITDGHIMDSNGNPLGFISPSPAATNELK